MLKIKQKNSKKNLMEQYSLKLPEEENKIIRVKLKINRENEKKKKI